MEWNPGSVFLIFDPLELQNEFAPIGRARRVKTRGAGVGQISGGRGNGQRKFGTGECPYGNATP